MGTPALGQTLQENTSNSFFLVGTPALGQTLQERHCKKILQNSFFPVGTPALGQTLQENGPGLPHLFVCTVSDQELDIEKAWDQTTYML